MSPKSVGFHVDRLETGLQFAWTPYSRSYLQVGSSVTRVFEEVWRIFGLGLGPRLPQNTPEAFSRHCVGYLAVNHHSPPVALLYPVYLPTRTTVCELTDLFHSVLHLMSSLPVNFDLSTRSGKNWHN